MRHDGLADRIQQGDTLLVRPCHQNYLQSDFDCFRRSIFCNWNY